MAKARGKVGRPAGSGAAGGMPAGANPTARTGAGAKGAARPATAPRGANAKLPAAKSKAQASAKAAAQKGASTVGSGASATKVAREARTTTKVANDANATKVAGAASASRGVREVGTSPVGKRAKGDEGIEALTAEIREALRTWNDSDAGSRVRVGDVLQKAKARLEHGAWLGWVEAQVPNGKRWAQLSMQLSVWSRANAEMFRRVRWLGSTKVTELMRLEMDRLEALLSRRDHLVPSTGERLTLEVMSVAELQEVLKGGPGKRGETPQAEAVKKMIAVGRQSVDKTIAFIGWMVANKNAVSAELAEDVHDDLAVAAAGLATEFGLDAAD